MGTHGITWPVLALALAGGCLFRETTTSTTGALVTDVRPRGDGLEVTTCWLRLRVTEQDSLLSQRPQRVDELTTDDCFAQLLVLPPGLGRAGGIPVPTTAPPTPEVRP